MTVHVGEPHWRQWIADRRALRVVRHKDLEVIEPLALVKGKTSVFAHCRVILPNGGFTFRNFVLDYTFKQVDVLPPDTRSSHPWEWAVGSHPSPGFTVLYRGGSSPLSFPV